MHAGKVYLIGAGPGDPELLTLKAVKALQAADVWLVDDLVSREVIGFARPDARIVHVGKRGGCRSTPQDFIHRLMLRYARQGKVVARVKGGDPFIFGRGGEEWAWLAERGVTVEAVGGLTAGLAVGPALGLPLTHRGLSRGVTLVTAHTQDGSPLPWAALAQSGLTVVCYMGMSDLSTLTAEWREAGFAADLPVAVVHRVGCPEQRAIVTNLSRLADDVRTSGLASPAVIVLGEVASLAALQPQMEQACKVA